MVLLLERSVGRVWLCLVCRQRQGSSMLSLVLKWLDSCISPCAVRMCTAALYMGRRRQILYQQNQLSLTTGTAYTLLGDYKRDGRWCSFDILMKMLGCF